MVFSGIANVVSMLLQAPPPPPPEAVENIGGVSNCRQLLTLALLA